VNYALEAQGVRRSAVVSRCGVYRYSLVREWSERSDTRLLFVMLNPSVADGTVDDPTVRRCIGFARLRGHGSLEIVNLYAYRATDPGVLKRARAAGFDVVGPENADHVAAAVARAERIVAAWGGLSESVGGVSNDAARAALAAHGRDVWCLGTTRDGAPLHPLRLAAATPLVLFASAAAAVS
jgi:hypothetical protein